VKVSEAVEFNGHPLIKATHRSTFEVTRDELLSTRGDCVIGVKADRSGLDFNREFKQIVADHRAVVYITVKVEGEFFTAVARGHPDLTLSHPSDLVVRRSTYICPRTLAVLSDKSAADIPRSMVQRLRDPGVKGVMEVVAEGP